MRRNGSTYLRKTKKTGLLSTAGALGAPQSPFVHKMEKIERACAERGISIAHVCELAGVRDRQWRRWRTGPTHPRPSSLRKMERAITRLVQLDMRRERGEGDLAPVAYRMLLVHLAERAGLDVAMVVADNPQDQDNQSPEKAAASLCRQRALYLIVTELNVPQVVAGRFAGITKQAVSKSLRQIEESRDDETINALLDEMAGLIHGSVVDG